MCLAPAPGLPTEFSSAVVRAEAGESAERGASRAGKQEECQSYRQGGGLVGVGAEVGQRPSPGLRQIA